MVGDTVFVTNPADESQRVGQIAAIDAASGKVRWRFAPPSGNVAVAGPSRDGVLFVSSAEDGTYALSDEGDSYTIAWQGDVSGIRSPFALAGDTLYALVQSDGAVVAVDATDGTLLWKTDGPGQARGPVVSGGMIFTADDGGGSVRAYAEPALIALLPDRTLAMEPSGPTLSDLPDPFRVVRETPLEDLGVTLSPFDPPRSGGPEGVSMTVGPDGLLYVIDPASVVTVIDPATAAVVRRFGRHGAGEGEFECGGSERARVCSIDSAPDGRLYVVDPGNHRVQILASDGSYLRQLGSYGNAEGQFIAPLNLAVDASGSAYVLDIANGMISKFDSDGAYDWRVGGPSRDPRLAGAVDLAVMKDGTILVTIDPGGPAVLLDPDDGSVVGPWGDGSIGASAEPVVDPAGNVFLFQYVPGAMRMFDREGRPVGIRDIKTGTPATQQFYPPPVFAEDGYGYSFDDTQGLIRIEITLP
jgi:DNA-binding beta-propeller fold protein YncE